MKSILFLAVLVASLFAHAQPMRVLFVGNSYTHYNNMPEMVQKMADSKGIKAEIVMDAKSSHTFQMHSKRPELYESIRSRKWDYVVLQGFSRELAQDQSVIDTASIPYLKQLLDSIYKNNACTNVLLYQTWGYKTGFIEDSTINWDYQTMTDRIHRGYLYVADSLHLPIVPVGRVWETIKENHPELNLYQEDLQHPSIIGSYVSACCFYTALFKSDPDVSFYAGLSPKIAESIQECAGTLLKMNLKRYHLDQNTFQLDVKTINGKKTLLCTSTYPNAKSVRWDFGDGKSSTSADCRHQYVKSGSYEITLTVTDACGKRVIKRRVSV
jgi:hypothetical protein